MREEVDDGVDGGVGYSSPEKLQRTVASGVEAVVVLECVDTNEDVREVRDDVLVRMEQKIGRGGVEAHRNVEISPAAVAERRGSVRAAWRPRGGAGGGKRMRMRRVSYSRNQGANRAANRLIWEGVVMAGRGVPHEN